MPGTTGTSPPCFPSSRDAKELRLAIAIRGGVSLAVWMGGAVREIVRLHDASRNNRGTYARLLVVCGYTDLIPDGDGRVKPVPVTIDVLAGTSAGGLNASLLAAHLVYKVPFDDGIRNVWLQVGDLELLTRSPGESRPPSLLQGDEGFYARMAAALQTLAGTVQEPPPPAETSADPAAQEASLEAAEDRGDLQSLRLILTATRLEPRVDALRPDRGNPLVFDDSRAHFRFRYRYGVEAAGAHGPLSDFGLDDDSRRFTLDRLAYAARATSSFPGAFEPARIRVGDREHGRADGQLRLPLDFHGVSSETMTDLAETSQSVELIDGGVLDNIPIDWALRAIAGSPATRPVDRWLLYLEPVPQEAALPTTIESSQRSVTRLTRIVAATMRTRGQASSMLRNAEQFRVAEDDVYRLTALAGTGALSGSADAVIEEAMPTPRIDDYLCQVRQAAGIRSLRLLEDPLSILGPDPLEVPALDLPLRPMDWAGISPAFLAELRAVHGEIAFPDATDLDTLRVSTMSPLPVARAATLLNDWLREIERALGTAIPRLLRRMAYRARFAAEVLVAVSDRLFIQEVQAAVEVWDRAGRPSPADGSSLPELIVPYDIARATCRSFSAAVSSLSMPPSFASRWHTWATALARLITDLPGGLTAELGSPLAGMWDRLASLAIEIGSHAPQPSSDATDPFLALRDAATGPDPMTRVLRVLSSAEVLIGPLRSDPLAEPTDVQVAALSAGVGGPLDDRIFTKPLPTTPKTLVDRKLAGNQVHNFAAFVSSRWRMNDWTWGRLDTARSLTEIAVEHRKEEFTGAAVKELFLAGDPIDPMWAEFLESEWAALQITDAEPLSRRRAIDIITTRLQWEILAEEMPLVRDLASVKRSRNDLPPTDRLLAEAREAVRPVEPGDVVGLSPEELAGRNEARRLGMRPPIVQCTPAEIVATLPVFGAIGDESVKELTKKRGLRRSVLRLGLVGWRAVYPSGTHPGARIARVLLFLLEPIVWLPLLFDVAAPLATIFAGFLMLGAVAITVNHPVSLPADLIIITGLLISFAVLWWQRSKKPPTWKTILPAILLVVGLYAAAISVWATVNETHSNLTNVERALAAAGCVLLATFTPLWWVLKFGGFWGKVRVVTTGLATAAAAFGVALATAEVGGGNASKSWLVLLVLYVPLLVEALMLHHWFPRALPPQEPVIPGYTGA